MNTFTFLDIVEIMSVPMGKVVMATARAGVQPEFDDRYSVPSVKLIINEIKGSL